MDKNLKFLDSRMYKRILLRCYPRDKKRLSGGSYYDITGEHIVKNSFNLTESINKGDEWKFGIAEKSVLKVKIHIEDGVYVISNGDIMEVYAQTFVPPDSTQATEKTTPLGCFEVDTIERIDDSRIYEIVAYSYGIDRQNDVLHTIEGAKVHQWNPVEKTYNLPIDALALEALDYSFNRITKSNNATKTGSSNRSIARFGKTPTGWKEVVLELDYYTTGDMDTGWDARYMYRPVFEIYGADEAATAIQQYFNDDHEVSDVTNMLYGALYTHYSFMKGFEASIVNNATNEEYNDDLLGQASYDAPIKESGFFYGYQLPLDWMPGKTCIIIPTAVSVWQISGTGKPRSATQLYRQTISRNSYIERYYLNDISDYITLKTGGSEIYEGITAEDVLGSYCEFKGIKLRVNRNYSRAAMFSEGGFPCKEFTGVYDEPCLYPENDLHPSNRLYPSSGSDNAITPIGREMINSVKLSPRNIQHRYGSAFVPRFYDEGVASVLVRGFSDMSVSDQEDIYIYDRTYSLLENVYLKLKNYDDSHIINLLAANGFWSRLSRIPDNPKCTLKITGVPFVEAGDFIAVYDKNKANEFVPLLVTQRTMSGEQGMKDDINTSPLQKTV